MKVRTARSHAPKLVSVLATLGLATGLIVAVATPAAAVSASQSTLVSAVPAAFTPNVDGGVVYSIAQVGDWIVLGGSFTNVTPHGSTTAVNQANVLAFDQSTGALDTGFVPALNGVVNSVIAGPTANSVYVGGQFSTVNGVKSKGVTLLSLSDGSIVGSFKPPALNGIVYAMRQSAGRLFLAGTFTLTGTTPHDGLATLNPTTGALDPFMNVQLTGHHNYTGQAGQANGAVGGRAMDISPDGTRAIILGDFKSANGALHDQIVMLDLNGSSVAIDPNWNTSAFTAACSANSFDTYVESVDFSPDGSYFAIANTGGGGTSYNTDGTRSLCDSASRWSTTATGTNVAPTWVDYTGNDTFWSIAVTGTAIYVGGHERWVNNPNGTDAAGAGALPRPGIVALDPSNGLPFSWNPGRNPRGAGAYALLATAQGLYVGSDTNYIGNMLYQRDEIAFFPLAGGESLPSTATAQLPGNLYEAGPTNTGSANALTSHAVSASAYGAATTVPTAITWGAARGAFMAGNTIFYAATDGNFYQASFDGTTVGTPVAIDPYDDPTWSSVQNGSGGTYQGRKPAFYSVLASVTGAFYSNGRIYYSQSGKSALYWRYFTPESGVIGGTEYTVTGVSFTNVAGMVLSGSTLYYANKNDGTLHALPFVNGIPATTGDKTVSGPAIDGNDWRSRGLFIYGASAPVNTPPVASATVACAGLTCTFDGTASSDPDGSIVSDAWSFGDGSTGTGVTTSHTYSAAGTFAVSLTVTDNGGATNTWTSAAIVSTGAPTPVSFVGGVDFNGSTATPSVIVPTGVSAGDTELLFVSVNAAGVTTSAPTGLPGWTQLSKITNSTLETTVFQRSATAGDAGQSVTVPLTAAAKVDIQLADYRGVAAGPPTFATGVDFGTGTHVAPAISVAAAGSWVLSYWSDRSSGTTAWTLPPAVTPRGSGIGTGTAQVSAVLADSGQPVAAGAYPSLTATANFASGRGNMLTLVLAPAA